MNPSAKNTFEKIVFLDIETTPQYNSYEKLPEALKKLWEVKVTKQKLLKENETPAGVYHNAGLYAEFGKVICIVTGYFSQRQFHLRTFSGDDEKKLLMDFSAFIELFAKYCNGGIQLCAHNGKEFDYPYLARRMIINRLPIPGILDNAGKKPWEISLLDTLELWKFGDYKAYTSLNLLAYVLGLPSPKQDMDGSMVYSFYYEKNDLPSIIKYCSSDVITLANVFLRIKGMETFGEEKVVMEG